MCNSNITSGMHSCMLSAYVEHNRMKVVNAGDVQVNLEQLQSERDDMEKEFEEIKRQLEEDTDKEIEDMKER